MSLSLPKVIQGACQWLSGKESACQCRRHKRGRFDPGSGRSPGVGNGNQLQYSCLENSMGRGALQTIVHRVAKSQDSIQDMTEYAGPLGHPSYALVRWVEKTVSFRYFGKISSTGIPPLTSKPTRHYVSQCPWSKHCQNIHFQWVARLLLVFLWYRELPVSAYAFWSPGDSVGGVSKERTWDPFFLSRGK